MFETLLRLRDSLVDTLLSGEQFLVALYLYLGMIAIERLLAFTLGRRDRSLKSDLSNLAVTSISAVVGALGVAAAFVGLYLFFYQFRLFDVPINAAWGWVFVFLVHEFCYYLDHRLAHRIGFFWAFHQVHHGANEMDLTVAARGSVFDGIVQWTYWIIAPLLGVPLVMLLAVKFFTNLWGIFNHTRLIDKMGVLDKWLATPANHRVHHGRQAKYIDRNYGQVTVVFDRMFASFQPELEEPDYGLVKRVEGYNPIDHHLVGFRWLWRRLSSAPDWRSRIGYMCRPPDWHHECGAQPCNATGAGADA